MLDDIRDAAELKKKVKVSIHRKYPHNPVLVWMLINILLPIIIKLVMQWLANRESNN